MVSFSQVPAYTAHFMKIVDEQVINMLYMDAAAGSVNNIVAGLDRVCLKFDLNFFIHTMSIKELAKCVQAKMLKKSKYENDVPVLDFSYTKINIFQQIKSGSVCNIDHVFSRDFMIVTFRQHAYIYKLSEIYLLCEHILRMRTLKDTVH